jgi:hypothetical protein
MSLPVNRLFSTKIETPQVFMKLLAGFAYLLNKDPKEEICIWIDIGADGYFSYFYEGSRTPPLDSYIEEITTLFNPMYLPSDYRLVYTEPFVQHKGEQVIFIGESILSLVFHENNTHLQFPSAREKLEIPAYFASVFQNLPLKKESYKGLTSLLGLSSL